MHTGGQLTWLRPGGRLANGIEIEHHHVGAGTAADNAPIRDAEAVGCCQRALVDGVGEIENADLTVVSLQHPGVRAETARVCAPGRGNPHRAAHDGQGMSEERGNIGLGTVEQHH